jgi:hypothetical protein
MAWPTLTANDVLPGEPVSEAADSTGQMLYDRDEMVLNKGTTYAFDVATTASVTQSALTAAVLKQVYIPANLESGDYLHCYVETWNSGANNTSIYLYDVGSTTYGTRGLNDAGTTHEWQPSRLTLGAWGGTFRTIEIRGKVAAGTGSFRATDCFANMWFSAQ